MIRSRYWQARDCHLLSVDVTGNARDGHRPVNEKAPGELSELLGEIEREETPERLLQLALKLQAALAGQSQDSRRSDSLNSSLPV